MKSKNRQKLLIESSFQSKNKKKYTSKRRKLVTAPSFLNQISIKGKQAIFLEKSKKQTKV